MAECLGVSRSELYTRAVEEYVAKHSHEDVTARLNEVYAAEEGGVDRPQRRAQAKSTVNVEW